ncbi:MAG: hypothetical protein ABIS35_15180 [Terracoccus sp.]
MARIDFGDPRGHADLATFVGRARTANPDGAIRLQVIGSALLSTVAVLEGSGLMGDGTVLGLRISPLPTQSDAEARTDATVSFASLADRFARNDPSTSILDVPAATVRVPWAALTPPRDGWERVGTIDAAILDSIALQGISDIANGAPTGSGAQAVHQLRLRIWGTMSETVPPLPAGLAFAAHVLGFTTTDEPATLSANGRWTRLSTSRGHALVR